MVRKNFFVISEPVPPNLFFDRKEIVDFFRRSMERGDYKVLIALVAPFKFGKSSILLKLYDIARNYDSVVPVLLNLNIVYDPIRTLLARLSKLLGIDFLSKLNNVRRGKLSLHELFSLVNDQLEYMGKWAILFIDEFQYLAHLVKGEGFLTSYPDKYIFEFIRGVSEAFRFGLVVSGSLLGELMDSIDAWHGRFTIFRPREFPRDDSIVMLKTLFGLSGLNIDNDLANYIAIATCDHPYHMQLFGYYIVDQGKIDDESIENARRKILEHLSDYYDMKLLEARRLDPLAWDILKRAVNSCDISKLSDRELEAAIKLERRGFLFRKNGRFEIYDPMLRRYIMNFLSNRPIERYIPEYTAEYIVAKHLAYEEGFKEVLISFMSWGPFDIVIPKKIGESLGIGIQVKRTYQDKVDIPSVVMEAAEERRLIPILAMVKLPEKRIVFVDPKTMRKAEKLKEILQKQDS